MCHAGVSVLYRLERETKNPEKNDHDTGIRYVLCKQTAVYFDAPGAGSLVCDAEPSGSKVKCPCNAHHSTEAYEYTKQELGVVYEDYLSFGKAHAGKPAIHTMGAMICQ